MPNLWASLIECIDAWSRLQTSQHSLRLCFTATGEVLGLTHALLRRALPQLETSPGGWTPGVLRAICLARPLELILVAPDPIRVVHAKVDALLAAFALGFGFSLSLSLIGETSADNWDGRFGEPVGVKFGQRGFVPPVAPVFAPLGSDTQVCPFFLLNVESR